MGNQVGQMQWGQIGVRIGIGVEFLSVHNDRGMEDGDGEECCSEG